MKLDVDVADALRTLKSSSLRKDREADRLLKERDSAQEWADKLAEAIGAYFDRDVGEHSNLNNPWAVALELIEDAGLAAAKASLTEKLKAKHTCVFPSACCCISHD